MTPVVVRLDELPPEGQTHSLELAPTELDEALGEAGFGTTQSLAPLEADARVLVSGEDVFVLGTMRTRVRYQCVRCLAPFEEKVEADIHLTFTGDTEFEVDLELHPEDLEIEVLHGRSVDLTRAALEQLYLALRPYPVCRESCRGLCPECGADRNTTDCGCARRLPDLRFAALEKWAQRQRNQNP